jgi:hypothetical protein
MKEKTIVQFVCFETKLDSEAFILQWDQYVRSFNSNIDVTLQQAKKGGSFSYVAQHRCPPGEFQFVFMKGRRSSKTPEVEIKAKQVGGYSALQLEWISDPEADENKIFVFITNPQTDLDIYRRFSTHGNLNIYEAYYENCGYAYILEFFVKENNAAELMQQLKDQTPLAEIGIFKECLVHA